MTSLVSHGLAILWKWFMFTLLQIIPCLVLTYTPAVAVMKYCQRHFCSVFLPLLKKNLALFISFGYDSHRVRDVQLCPQHCLSWPSQWVPRSIRGRFVCLRRSWGRGWWRPRRRLRRPRTRPARSCPWYFSEGPCGPADGSRQGLIAIAQDAIRHTNKKHCHWFDCTLNHIVNFK